MTFGGLLTNGQALRNLTIGHAIHHQRQHFTLTPGEAAGRPIGRGRPPLARPQSKLLRSRLARFHIRPRIQTRQHGVSERQPFAPFILAFQITQFQQRKRQAAVGPRFQQQIMQLRGVIDRGAIGSTGRAPILMTAPTSRPVPPLPPGAPLDDVNVPAIPLHR